jgi:hypothetical protein
MQPVYMIELVTDRESWLRISTVYLHLVLIETKTILILKQLLVLVDEITLALLLVLVLGCCRRIAQRATNFSLPKRHCHDRH